MRDPGPGTERPGSALLSSLAEHTASKLQRTEQSCRPSLPPPKAAIFSPCFIPSSRWRVNQSRNKCMVFILHFYLCRNKSLFYCLLLSGWCAPVFVFRQEEASAASLSAPLFLKDMRSYPAQPFPLPANPNKAGMLREREGRLKALCFWLEPLIARVSL